MTDEELSAAERQAMMNDAIRRLTQFVAVGETVGLALLAVRTDGTVMQKILVEARWLVELTGLVSGVHSKLDHDLLEWMDEQDTTQGH